jgi:hypothetical protein
MFRGSFRRLAGGERQRDFSEAGRQLAQPFGEVDPADGDVGWRRSLVFDEDLLPAACFLIEQVEPLDEEALPVLSVM